MDCSAISEVGNYSWHIIKKNDFLLLLIENVEILKMFMKNITYLPIKFLIRLREY